MYLVYWAPCVLHKYGFYYFSFPYELFREWSLSALLCTRLWWHLSSSTSGHFSSSLRKLVGTSPLKVEKDSYTHAVIRKNSWSTLKAFCPWLKDEEGGFIPLRLQGPLPPAQVWTTAIPRGKDTFSLAKHQASLKKCWGIQFYAMFPLWRYRKSMAILSFG